MRTCRASASTRCRPAWAASRARSARSPPRTTPQAAKDISAVSGACTQLAGGAEHRPGLPVRLPRPVGHPGRPDLLRLRHQLGGREHPDHRLHRPHALDRGRQRPAEPPRLGHAQLHLGPRRRHDRRHLPPLLRGRRRRHRARSASRWRRPASPRARSPTRRRRRSSARSRSAAPSTRPRSSTPTGRRTSCGSPAVPARPRSGRSSWLPSGTSFVAGTNPTSLLVPDQPWEAGTVEAPDMVTTGGRYYLFFSGNDWNSAQLRGGRGHLHRPAWARAATPHRAHPLERAGVAGPGGESVFADTSGNFWIAFHAWVPGAVGFPNSRDLYLRRLTFSGTGADGRPVRLESAGRRQRFGPPGDARRVHGGAQCREVAPSAPSSATRRPRRAASGRSASVARSLKRRASSRPSCSVAASLAAPRTATSQSPGSGGMSSMWLPAGQDGGGRLGPPAGQPGEPVRAVTDQRQIVGDGSRADAELGA